VGRVLDLAKFLARQGRIAESDALFTRAEQIRPDDPRVIFARARSYVEGKRNLDDARQLLQRYATLDLTPDDPPRAAAEKLLRRIAAE
jgi:Flp pilus assembly protein TadD